jgi:hypothetical protein
LINIALIKLNDYYTHNNWRIKTSTKHVSDNVNTMTLTTLLVPISWWEIEFGFSPQNQLRASLQNYNICGMDHTES